jgi:hypothetical protein
MNVYISTWHARMRRYIHDTCISKYGIYIHMLIHRQAQLVLSPFNSKADEVVDENSCLTTYTKFDRSRSKWLLEIWTLGGKPPRSFSL